MCFDVQTNRIRLLNELRHENAGWINRHLACNYCLKPGPAKQADKLSLLVLFEEGKCFDCYELHMKIYCAFSICHLYCGIILLLYWILIIAVIMQVREPIWILKRLVYLLKGRGKGLILLDDLVLSCLCCPWAIHYVLTRVVCHSELNWECFLNSNSVPDFALVYIPHYMPTFIFSMCSYRCCCSTNFVISLLSVEFMYLDLASLTSVRHFVQRYKAKGLPLHILVNNGT